MTMYLEMAKKSVLDCPSTDTRFERTELRKQQLAEAKIELSSVLPVEGTAAREVIQQRIELLEHTIQDPTFEERYPCLDMEVLSWRDEQGFPKLALFSLDDPLFTFGANYYGWLRRISQDWQISTSITKFSGPMAGMYADIFKHFRDDFLEDLRKTPDLRRGNWHKSISSRFRGVIPQWVRDKISEASADFSVSTPRVEMEKIGWLRKREVTIMDVTANMFLIAEVEKWEVNKEVDLNPDPLLVGYKHGCFWLICSFDETPLEKYVHMEFTV